MADREKVRTDLLKELDRIIDVGIVNAHHDKDVLKEVREQLQESDLDAIKRIFGNCKNLNGKWDVHTCETEEMEFIYDLTIRDLADDYVTLSFDENGKLFA